MTEAPGNYEQADIEKLTYEQKVEKLDELLTRLDNSETPIDKLAEDVKLGARLLKELGQKLKQVETEVRDAFKELDEKEDQE
jgi:exodeoxyribonuclease VII small subunit